VVSVGGLGRTLCRVAGKSPFFAPPTRPLASSAMTKNDAVVTSTENSPTVDIGILMIKEEEFEAVLGVFPGRQPHTGPSQRHYSLCDAPAGNGAHYRVAIVRAVEQGNGEAQDAARDMLSDLSPRLILVVGIAGAVPSDDLTLGDVVLSLRVHDYSVEARKEGEAPEYAMSGGPVGVPIERHVADLPARRQDLGDWTAGLSQIPQVSLAPANFYGPEAWVKRVRISLERHFSGPPRAPKYKAGTIGTSDRLVKDAGLLIPWLETTRNLLAVEMESGGVYRAARGRCAMLAIRGISDVIGFKRDEQWTRFACASAAAFAKAYLRTGPIPNPR